ncbi:Flagellin [Bacillus thuringiensis serovar pakistani str. T13001]|nr:Flagellin [Bacillus thuringiensis serovar pakistani str. T13001]
MLLMFVLILMLRNPHFFILIFLLIVKRKYAKKINFEINCNPWYISCQRIIVINEYKKMIISYLFIFLLQYYQKDYCKLLKKTLILDYLCLPKR